MTVSMKTRDTHNDKVYGGVGVGGCLFVYLFFCFLFDCCCLLLLLFCLFVCLFVCFVLFFVCCCF